MTSWGISQESVQTATDSPQWPNCSPLWVTWRQCCRNWCSGLSGRTGALHLLLVRHWNGPWNILPYVFKCVFPGTVRCQDQSFRQISNIQKKSLWQEEFWTNWHIGPVSSHDGSEPEHTCVLATVDPPLRFLSKMCLLLWNVSVFFGTQLWGGGGGVWGGGVAQLEVR